jgi:hypothetical protein
MEPLANDVKTNLVAPAPLGNTGLGADQGLFAGLDVQYRFHTQWFG